MALLVAVIAMGSSAFTTFKRGGVFRYYKVVKTYPLATDPRGYQYFSADRCEPVGNVCSAEWDIGFNSMPIADGTPLSSGGVIFVTGSLIQGHFE